MRTTSSRSRGGPAPRRRCRRSRRPGCPARWPSGGQGPGQGAVVVDEQDPDGLGSFDARAAPRSADRAIGAVDAARPLGRSYHPGDVRGDCRRDEAATAIRTCDNRADAGRAPRPRSHRRVDRPGAAPAGRGRRRGAHRRRSPESPSGRPAGGPRGGDRRRRSGRPGGRRRGRGSGRAGRAAAGVPRPARPARRAARDGSRRAPS